jgi:hypothetical protein
MLVAIVADKATAKLLTDVIAAAFTEVKADTANIFVLLLLILVARATDVAANSASVAKPVPSPITLFIEVIAAEFTDVNTDTAAMFVFELLILVAIVALTAASSALVAKFEPSPKIELIEVIAFMFVVILVLLLFILVAKVADSATAKLLTDVILVLAVPILVAKAKLVAASSALVAKPPPPILNYINTCNSFFIN